MMQYGNINAAGGGGGIAYWYDKGAGIIDIINAMGIDAVLPADTRFHKAMVNSGPGDSSSGDLLDDGSAMFQNGVQDAAGIKAAKLEADDFTANAFAVISALLNGVALMYSADLTGRQSNVSISPVIVEQYIKDATGAHVAYRRTNALAIHDRVARGASFFESTLDENDFQLINNSTGEVFAVDQLGKIRTNQTAAPGAHVVLAAELPVYDNTGALVGYIPVYT